MGSPDEHVMHGNIEIISDNPHRPGKVLVTS
jgi:hypothetical protein